MKMISDDKSQCEAVDRLAAERAEPQAAPQAAPPAPPAPAPVDEDRDSMQRNGVLAELQAKWKKKLRN